MKKNVNVETFLMVNACLRNISSLNYEQSQSTRCHFSGSGASS